MSIYPTIKFNNSDLKLLVAQSLQAAKQDIECDIESVIPLALGNGEFELSINLKPKASVVSSSETKTT